MSIITLITCILSSQTDDDDDRDVSERARIHDSPHIPEATEDIISETVTSHNYCYNGNSQ